MSFEPNISLAKIMASVSHTLGSPYDDYLKQKIKFLAINFRAKLFRQDAAKNSLSKAYLVSLNCIPLQCVDIGECCGGDKAFENTLRTIDKIPKPLRTKDNESFYYVGQINKMSAFTETTFPDYKNTQYLRFTGKHTRYVYLDDYIYILNPPTKDFDTITVIDLFEDVTQALQLKNCDGNYCYTDDDPFPIGGDMYEALETYLLTTLGNSKPNDNKEIKVSDN